MARDHRRGVLVALALCCSVTACGGGGRGGTLLARPADACSLLTPAAAAELAGNGETFRSHPHGRLATGYQPWGCVWNSPSSFVTLFELEPTTVDRLLSAPECPPETGIGERACLDRIGHPSLRFVVAGRGYSVEVVRDRRPPFPPDDDEKAAAAEREFATQLAG